MNTSETIFFSHAINERNELDPNIRSSSNYHVFRNTLFEFIRPVERKIFNDDNPFGMEMLTRVILCFLVTFVTTNLDTTLKTIFFYD